MNTRLFLYAALLALAACGDNGPEMQDERGEIRLFAELVQPTRAVNHNVNLQNSQFKDGTAVSVKVTDNAVSGAVSYPLALYTADGLGNLLMSGSARQYYPASGSSVNIYAYHPAGAGGENGDFAVQSNQISDAAFVASDLMWASLTNISKTSTDAQRVLQFSHLLSKINVHLVMGAGVEDDDVNTASITVKDVILKGTFTAATGAFSAAADEEDNRGDITITTSAGAPTQHVAIVVPQTMSGKKIEVILGETVKTYIIPNGVTFAPGMQYTYTFVVNFSGIVLVSTQINPWIDDAGNVTSPESPLVI